MRGERCIAVIGIGNPMRRDDGAGLEVVDRVQTRLPAGAITGRCAGDPTALLDAWVGRDLAVVVDAARWPGAQPGDVVWIEGAETAMEAMPWSEGFGTHGLTVPQAIRLGRAMGRLPARLAVLAIAIGDDSHGPGLSPVVEEAVSRAADIIVRRLRSVAQETAGGDS